jgi:hypothetical protein
MTVSCQINSAEGFGYLVDPLLVMKQQSGRMQIMSGTTEQVT